MGVTISFNTVMWYVFLYYYMFRIDGPDVFYNTFEGILSCPVPSLEN